MKDTVSVAVGLLVVVLGIGAVLMAPKLQSPRSLVDEQVSPKVEAARRLIHSYREDMAALGGLREDLIQGGVPISREDAALSEAADDPDLFDQAQVEWQQYQTSPEARKLQSLEQRYLAMAGDQAKPQPGLPAGASAMRQAAQSQQEILDANLKLLREAERQLGEAGGVSVGDASGSGNVQVSHLRGLLDLLRGMTTDRQAAVLRREAGHVRREIQDDYAFLNQAAVLTRIVEESGIDNQINDLLAAIAKTAIEENQAQEEVDRLRKTTQAMTAALDAARRRADGERQVMETMTQEGIAFNNPQSLKNFRESYLAHAQKYAESVKEAQIVERGTLDHAVLDGRDNYLEGAYIPAAPGESVKIQRGLRDYKDDLQTAELQLEGLKSVHRDLEDAVAALRSERDQYAQVASKAADRVKELGAHARAAAERLAEVCERINEVEEQTIDHLSVAAKSFATAARLAESHRQEARQAIADVPAGPKQDALPESVSSQDQASAAYLLAKQAEAQMRLGMVYWQRYRMLEEQIVLLATVGRVINLPMSESELQTQRAAARRSGEEQLVDSVNLLQDKVLRPLKNNFAAAGQLAGAYFLFGRFGHPDETAYAADLYEALINSTSEKYADDYKPILEYLRGAGKR